MKRSTIGYIVFAVFVIAGFAWVEKRANDQKEALRTVICLAERNTRTSGQRTEQEKEAIVAFYAEVLKSIGAEPCDPLPITK